MHISVITIVVVFILSTVSAQNEEHAGECTTLECRRNLFLTEQRKELNEMQMDIMEMLMKIQLMNEQEAYLVGLHGAQHQQQHQQQQQPHSANQYPFMHMH